MYLQLLNYVSYFFNGLFTILIFRTFALPYLKSLWNNYTYSKKEKELLAQGNKKFPFEKGKVIVFAKTEEQANAQYRDMKRELKKAAR